MAGRVPLMVGLHKESRELRAEMIYLVEATRISSSTACIEAKESAVVQPMQGRGELVVGEKFPQVHAPSRCVITILNTVSHHRNPLHALASCLVTVPN